MDETLRAVVLSSGEPPTARGIMAIFNLENGRWYFGRIFVPKGARVSAAGSTQFALALPNWGEPAISGVTGKTWWKAPSCPAEFPNACAVQGCSVPWPMLNRTACDVPTGTRWDPRALANKPIDGTIPGEDRSTQSAKQIGRMPGEPWGSEPRQGFDRTYWFVGRWDGVTGPQELSYRDRNTNLVYGFRDLWNEQGLPVQPHPSAGPPAVPSFPGGPSRPVFTPTGPGAVQPVWPGWVFPDGSEQGPGGPLDTDGPPGDTGGGEPSAPAKSSAWPWVLGAVAVAGVVGYAVMSSPSTKTPKPKRNPTGWDKDVKLKHEWRIDAYTLTHDDGRDMLFESYKAPDLARALGWSGRVPNSEVRAARGHHHLAEQNVAERWLRDRDGRKFSDPGWFIH